MLQERDNRVIDFIEEFKVARTSTIYELFFKNVSLRYCRKRLAKLCEYKELKREKNHISDEYIYYIQKPKHLKHELLLTDFYRELNKIVNIIGFKCTYSIGSIIADGLVGYKLKNTKGVIIAFVEIQTRNNPVDIEKYEKLFYSNEWVKEFESFPKVIAITNKKVKKVEEFEVIKIKENLKDIKKIGSH